MSSFLAYWQIPGYTFYSQEPHRLKLKRPPTVKKFRKELDELYAEALAEEEQNEGKKMKSKL